MPSRAVFLLAATGLAASLGTAAHGAITLVDGQAVNLGTVIFGTNNPDHSVIIGDKLFNFQAFTSAQFNQNNVFITGFIAANPLDGIGFDITGGFGDVIPNDNTISEFNLLYTVEVLPAAIAQGYRLKDVGLVFNGSATGAGSYSRVDESIFDYFGQPGQNLLGTLQANVINSSQTVQLQDYRDFSPNTYTKFQVNKDLKFYAFGPNDQASASFIRQSFSQRIIPAPGALALLGLGGLIAARRRRA